MRHRRTRGQALVEFALVIPVFLALLLGMIDLGRAVWAADSLASAAREAARFAIVHGGTASNPCPVGPPTVDTVIPAASVTCPHPSPSKEAIKAAAASAALAGGLDIVVTVCYGAGCSGDTDTPGATNARGTPVTVVISSRIPLTSAALLGIGPFNLSGSSTMLVNH